MKNVSQYPKTENFPVFFDKITSRSEESLKKFKFSSNIITPMSDKRLCGRTYFVFWPY